MALGQMNLGVIVTPYINQQALNGMARAAGTNFATHFNTATNRASQPLGRITGQVSDFEKSMAAANARVLAFGASAGSIYLIHDAFKKMVSSTIEVEKALADINVVLALGQTELKNFSTSMFKAASATGQTFQTASKVALEFARHGVSATETTKRMVSAMQLMRISSLSAGEAVNAITAAINSFNKEGLSSEDIVNRLTAVDTKFAVSAQDLAKAIERVGSTAVDAGVKFNQLLGLVTAVQTATSRGGAVIGNAFKSIFTRLSRPEVLSDLEAVGVVTKNAYGQVLPMVDIMKRLASSYDHLTYSQKSFISEAVGGVYQVNILKASLADLGRGFSIYDKAVIAASQSSGMIEKRMATLNDTIAAKLNTTTLQITRLFSSFGQTGFGAGSKGALDAFNSQLDFFASKLDEVGEKSGFGDKLWKGLAQGFAKGLGDIVSGPGIQMATALIAKLTLGLGKFAYKSGREVMGLNEPVEKQKALQQSIHTFLQQNVGLVNMWARGQVNLNTLSAIYLTQLRAANNLQATMTNAALATTGVTARGISFTPHTPARGFVPSFRIASTEEASSEKRLAMAHGYSAGPSVRKVVWDGHGGAQLTTINQREQVKEISVGGRRGSFIVPPNGFGKGTTFAASGFVPSFAVPPISPDILSSFSSGKEMLKYVNSLKVAGNKGSSRMFIPMGEGKGMKIALNKAGVAQNEVEFPILNSDYFAQQNYSEILPKGFGYDEDNFLWGVVEQLRKPTNKDFQKLIGAGRTKFLSNYRRKLSPVEEQIREFSQNYGILMGDFQSGRNTAIGQVEGAQGDLFGQPEMKDALKLMDIGFNDSVANRFYRRRDLGKFTSASGFVPSFGVNEGYNLGTYVRGGTGPHVLLSSMYDYLGGIGGPNYSNHVSGRSFATTDFSKIKLLEETHRQVSAQGGRVFYAPGAALTPYGEETGIASINALFLERAIQRIPQLRKSKEMQEFLESFKGGNKQQGLFGEEARTGLLKDTGEYYQKARAILLGSGMDKNTVTKKMGRAVHPLVDEMIAPMLGGTGQWATNIVEVVSRGGKVAAPDSQHILYPFAAHGGQSERLGAPVNMAALMEQHIPNESPKSLRGRWNNLTPFGFRITGNEPSLAGFNLKKFGLGAGYVPSFGLYHKEIGLPDEVKTQLSLISGTSLPLFPSNHARDEMMKDVKKFGNRIPFLPKKFQINPDEIFEVEHNPTERGFGTTNITKIVLRRKGEKGLDQIMAVLPSGLIKSVWHNEATDTHKTLDPSRYTPLPKTSAGGFVPNFKNFNLPRLKNAEIKRRMAEAFSKGSDYKDFYSIIGSAFSSKKDAITFGGIASALSPRVPDYVAGPASVNVFRHFKETGSQNVDDYLHLPVGVGNYTKTSQLGFFGPRGAKRAGLGKAIRGETLARRDYDKTRHYAEALAGNENAFPIDTNVLKTVFGKIVEGTLRAGPARRLIRLARETASELGVTPRELQAGIFKGANTRFADKYSLEYVHDLKNQLSSIANASGFVPSFGVVSRKRMKDFAKLQMAEGEGYIPLSKSNSAFFRNLASMHGIDPALNPVEIAAILSKTKPQLFQKLWMRGMFNFPQQEQALQDAIKREGTPTATVGVARELQSASNPLGLGVYDKAYQSNLGQAFSQHIALGQTNLKTMGSNAAEGFVPNFGVMDSIILGTLQGTVNNLNGILAPLAFGYRRQLEIVRRMNDEYVRITTQINNGLEVRYQGTTYNARNPVTGGLDRTTNYRNFARDFRVNNPLFTAAPSVHSQFNEQYNTYREGLETRQRRISSFGTATMIVGPMLGEAGAGLAKGFGAPNLAKGLEEVSAGVTSAGQLLMTFPGKLGVALAVGEGFKTAADSVAIFNSGFGQLQKSYDIASTRAEKIAAAGNQVMESFERLKNASTDASVSIEDYNSIQVRHTKALAELAAVPGGRNIVRELDTAGTDSRRREILAKAVNAQNQEKGNLNVRMQMAQAQANSSIFNWNFNKGRGGIFGATSEGEKVTKQQLVRDTALQLQQVGMDSDRLPEGFAERMKKSSLSDADIAAMKAEVFGAAGGGTGKGSDILNDRTPEEIGIILKQFEYEMSKFKVPAGVSADDWEKHRNLLNGLRVKEAAIRLRYNQELQNTLSKGSILANFAFQNKGSNIESAYRQRSFGIFKEEKQADLTALTTAEGPMIKIRSKLKEKEIRSQMQRDLEAHSNKGAETLGQVFAGVTKDYATQGLQMTGQKADTAVINERKAKQLQYLSKRQKGFAETPDELIKIAQNKNTFAEKYLGNKESVASATGEGKMFTNFEYDALANKLSAAVNSQQENITSILVGTKQITEKGLDELKRLGEEQTTALKEARFKELAAGVKGIDELQRGGARKLRRELRRDEYIMGHSRNVLRRGEAARDLLNYIPSDERDYKNPQIKRLYDTAASGSQSAFNYIYRGTSLERFGHSGERGFARVFGNYKGDNMPPIPKSGAEAPPINTSALEASVKEAGDKLKNFGDGLMQIGTGLEAFKKTLKEINETIQKEGDKYGGNATTGPDEPKVPKGNFAGQVMKTVGTVAIPALLTLGTAMLLRRNVPFSMPKPLPAGNNPASQILPNGTPNPITSAANQATNALSTQMGVASEKTGVMNRLAAANSKVAATDLEGAAAASKAERALLGKMKAGANLAKTSAGAGALAGGEQALQKTLNFSYLQKMASMEKVGTFTNPQQSKTFLDMMSRMNKGQFTQLSKEIGGGAGAMRQRLAAGGQLTNAEARALYNAPTFQKTISSVVSGAKVSGPGVGKFLLPSGMTGQEATGMVSTMSKFKTADQVRAYGAATQRAVNQHGIGGLQAGEKFYYDNVKMQMPAQEAEAIRARKLLNRFADKGVSGEKAAELLTKGSRVAAATTTAAETTAEVASISRSAALLAKGRAGLAGARAIGGRALASKVPLLGTALGGFIGMETAESDNMEKTEGFIHGALTGGTHKGSIFGQFGMVKKGGATDKALGFGGAALAGGAVGATIGSVVPVVGTAVGGGIGAAIGVGVEGLKYAKDAYVKGGKGGVDMGVEAARANINARLEGVVRGKDELALRDKIDEFKSETSRASESKSKNLSPEFMEKYNVQNLEEAQKVQQELIAKQRKDARDRVTARAIASGKEAPDFDLTKEQQVQKRADAGKDFAESYSKIKANLVTPTGTWDQQGKTFGWTGTGQSRTYSKVFDPKNITKEQSELFARKNITNVDEQRKAAIGLYNEKRSRDYKQEIEKRAKYSDTYSATEKREKEMATTLAGQANAAKYGRYATPEAQKAAYQQATAAQAQPQSQQQKANAPQDVKITAEPATLTVQLKNENGQVIQTLQAQIAYMQQKLNELSGTPKPAAANPAASQ